ncbi:MAG: glycosyltransferase, partial [Methylococcales bacterium]
VHFLPADLAFSPEHTSVLQKQGTVCYYRPWTKSLFSWLKQNADHFDLIIVCRVSLMSSLYDVLRFSASKAKLIFDTVDLHHVREAQEAELTNSDSLRKQARQTKDKEYALIGKCDETWVVSESEHNALEKAFPGKTIRLISNIHVIRHDTTNFKDRKDIVFVGNFQHSPNQDGLQWFLESIWPIVHAAQPNIRLNIVGASAPDNLLKISKGMNVVFHGRVENIEAIMDDTRINIAPLRYGAGAKGKISQALACGLPTIATTVAADGMQLIDQQSVLLADHADVFANTILMLYENETLWKNISFNAYRIAEDFFSAPSVTAKIKAALRD